MADETIGSEAADATGPEAAPLSLIYLDVDDEITSAAARIRAAGAERVALVLPYGSRLATSRINFRLLAREAAERGKRIEIICADPSARALALAAGLPVHPSVAAFEGRAPIGVGEGGSSAADPRKSSGAADQESAGRPATGAAAMGAVTPETEIGDGTQTRVLALPRRSSPRVPIVGPARPPVRTALAIGIGLALVALVLAGGFLALELLPSATIVLNPRSEALGPLPLTVEARADVTAPDPQSLVIPAQRFTFALQASQTFPATGTKITETKATGNVTFSNFDTGRSNRINAGSIVSTESGIEFATLTAVTLPNATIQFPFTVMPSTSTVGVEAVVGGEGGNVDNNTITVVPKGENKRLLTVTNFAATAGGARTESPQVSEADVSRARDALDLAIATELDRQVAEATGVPAGITLFPQTKIAGDSQFGVDPQTIVGLEAADFDLAATAQGTALGVDPSPVAAVADARLRNRVTPGWSLVPTSITSEVGSPSVLGEVISYPVTIRGTQVHDVDAKALVPQIEGLVLAEARSRLAAFGDVQITLWPDWVTTVPTRADRITFTLAEPKPISTPAASPASSPAVPSALSPAPSP